MWFYIVIALLTTLFFHFSTKCTNKVLRYICFAVFVLLPAVIEGFRDLNIGRDLQTYGIVYFVDASRSSSLTSYISNLQTTEWLYHLLNFLCSRIINEIHFFLFICAVIKMTLLGLTAYHFREKGVGCLLVFAYMLFFYWYGFSLMRQNLALCFCLYGFVYFYDRKYRGFVVCVIIGYFFHNSAVFMLFLLAIEILQKKSKSPIMIVSIGLIIMYFSAVTLFTFVATSGLFNENKYELYLNSGVESAKTNILMCLYFLWVELFLYRKIKNNKYVDRQVYVTSIISSLLALFFLFLSSMFETAFRVSFYQMIVLFVVIPIIVKNNRSLIFQFGYIFLLFLHIYIASMHGMADTIPYKSMILSLFI